MIEPSRNFCMQQNLWLINQVAIAGHPVHLNDVNVVFFKGLRPEFHSIIPSLANKPTPPATFDVLHATRES